MKYEVIASALFLAALGVQAQNCSVQDLGDPMEMGSAHLDANGNGRMFLTYSLPASVPVFGIRCLDESGNELWDRVISHLSPQVYVYGSRVEPLADGGCVALGGWMSPSHVQMLAVRLDAMGTTRWSRLYQTAFSQSLDEGIVDYREHPQGGFVMLTARPDSSYAITRLDSLGIPQWCKRISYGPVMHGANSLEVDANGELTIQGTASVLGGHLLHLDDEGTPLWSSTWSSFAARDIASTGTGFIVGGTGTPWTSSAMLLDQTGAVQWAYQYDMPVAYQNQLIEIPGGGFLLGYKSAADSLCMLRADASGMPQAHWGQQVETYNPSYGFALLSGDTLACFREKRPNFLPSWVHTRVMRSGQGMDFSCDMTAMGLPTVTPLTITVDPTLPTVQPDSMKTWATYLIQGQQAPCDVATDLAACGFSPGFSTTIYGWAQGLGNTSGPVTAVMKLEPYMTVSTISPPGGVLAGDSITWTGLAPLPIPEVHLFEVEVALPPNPALTGTVATITLTASQDSTETSLLNNVATWGGLITNAWDPNDKLVSPELVYDPAVDSVLHYTIRFQNTGTDTAHTVVVVDTLPTGVDVGSFALGGASHPCTYDLTAQGLLTFIFANIMLPDSGADLLGSNGLVTFTVKPDDGLALGTLISNEAGIYFDFNPPVITPPAEVVYGIVTAVPEEPTVDVIDLYPVPVRDMLTIMLPPGRTAREVVIHSSDGRLMGRHGVRSNGDRMQLPVDHLSKGLYLLVVVDQDGQRMVARFLKE